MQGWLKGRERLFDSYAKETAAALLAVDQRAVAEAAWILSGENRIGNNVFLIGNGGSLANADHIASDLSRRGEMRRVTSPSSLPYLTAVSNDISYPEVFLTYLKSMAMPGDGLIALSVSKTSPNIVMACEYWKDKGDVIGLWGRREPPGADAFADINIYVEHEDPRVVETVHLAIGQAWATLVGSLDA